MLVFELGRCCEIFNLSRPCHFFSTISCPHDNQDMSHHHRFCRLRAKWSLPFDLQVRFPPVYQRNFYLLDSQPPSRCGDIDAVYYDLDRHTYNCDANKRPTKVLAHRRYVGAVQSADHIHDSVGFYDPPFGFGRLGKARRQTSPHPRCVALFRWHNDIDSTFGEVGTNAGSA